MSLDPDLKSAREFLTTLFDDSDPTVCWQLFDDSKAKRSELARVMWGKLDDVLPTLREYQEKGAGVFIVINHLPHERPRRSANIIAARGLFIDEDGKSSLPSSWRIPPTLITQRDDKHWHAYWLFAEPQGNLPTWKAGMVHLSEYYGSDRAIATVERVMRVPGFWHQKAEPVMVRLVENAPAHAYTSEEIISAHPITSSDKKPGKKLVKVQEGERNTRLTSRAGALRRDGLEPDEIEAVLKVNNAKISNPLDDKEVTDIARSVGRYQPTVTAANGTVDSLAEGYLGCPARDVDDTHAAILFAIIDHMQKRGIIADATGALRWKGTGELAAVDLHAFCRAVAFDLRKSVAVQLSRVIETAEEILHRDAQRRRQAILAKLLKKPANAVGIVEVRRWVRAVTGSEKEADVQAVLHWLWLVKQKQSGRHGEQHHMLVAVGPQGLGKSEAVRKLVQPWEELADLKMEVTSLTDERSRPSLAMRAIGFLDELAGLTRTDAAELKATITASEVGYRPMRSNDRRVMPMLMTFIGTSNRSVAELVHDTSGARRFYELRTPQRCDWDTINIINYDLLWESVSEDDQAPGVLHRDLIATEQRKLVWRDPVERWLEDEDFGYAGLPDNRTLDRSDPRQGISTSELYGRYAFWCQRHGEKPASAEVMGRRLGEMGWEQYRPRVAGRRVQSYRLVNWKEDEGEMVRGGQGGQGDLSLSKIKNSPPNTPVRQSWIDGGHPDRADHPDRAELMICPPGGL